MPNHFQTCFYIKYARPETEKKPLIFRLRIKLYQCFRAVEKKLLINLKVKDIGDELFTNFSRKEFQ